MSSEETSAETRITADFTVHAVFRIPNSPCRSTTGESSSSDDPDPPEPTLRDQVHAAFDRVALSLSCTLPMLLEETRRRGIADDAVSEVLLADETAAAGGTGTDMHFQCYRSNAGVFYITRDTGPTNQLATSTEGFAELDPR